MSCFFSAVLGVLAVFLAVYLLGRWFMRGDLF